MIGKVLKKYSEVAIKKCYQGQLCSVSSFLLLQTRKQIVSILKIDSNNNESDINVKTHNLETVPNLKENHLLFCSK
jgi:hypothetical protein